MEYREDFRSYLTYNPDVDTIWNSFYNLDQKMKIIHSKGYYVSELNADTIVCVHKENQRPYLEFTSIGVLKNRDDILDNIKNLSVLAISSYLSVGIGFSDYTKGNYNMLKNAFESIVENCDIPDSNYHKQLIVYDKVLGYFSDNCDDKLHNTSNSRNRTIVKSTPQGGLYSNMDYENTYEKAGFIEIVFYPVIMISIITIAAVLYTMLK